MVDAMKAWPMAGHLPPGDHGARTGKGDAPLTLSERRPGSIVEVGCWPDTLNRMQMVLPQLARNTAILDLAPGRWWVVAEQTGVARDLERGIEPGLGAVVDLSDARAALRVSGPAMPDLISRILPLDFRDDRLPPGGSAETVTAHMNVTLHRVDATTVDLFVFRGFTRSFLHHVQEAARGFGYRVTSP
ncbi:MAG: hypothetical protein P1U65_09095 [Minwuia sp.]|nr:hypothetical protein [Minwuia sp.]